MSHPSSPQRKLSHRQIASAAESYAAAQFVLCGFDVLAQAGRANFQYDLGVARADGMMKIAVHASVNGFWDLADRYLDLSLRTSATTEDYHRAIDEWREQHFSQAVCCLVDFESTSLNQVPRLYLAAPWEVAEEMHERVDRLANVELGASGIDIIHRQQDLPAAWRLSQPRIAEFMKKPDQEPTFDSTPSADLEYPESAAMLLSALQFAIAN